MKKFDEKFKKSVLISWRRQPKSRSKLDFCNCWGISPRSLNRWIDEYEETTTGEAKQHPSAKESVIDYSKLKFTISNNNVQMFLGADSQTITAEKERYEELVSHLTKGQYELAWKLGNILNNVAALTCGVLQLKGGVVTVAGYPVKDDLTKILVKMVNESGSSKSAISFAKFMLDLYKNPNKEVINQLYSFMKHNCISINEDGSICGWKGVREDFMDVKTETISNKVGEKPSMPRHLVDADPDRTCSQGLHVGSKDYATNWGRRLVKVKVWPSDVVSIPTDYYGQKMRTCGYEVVEDLGLV